MDLFEFLDKVDEYVEKRKYQEAQDILLVAHGMAESHINASKSFAVPWTHNQPWDLHHDFDHDGIPDALDNHYGPGAFGDES